jgi:anti-sigma B factor antagonist
MPSNDRSPHTFAVFARTEGAGTVVLEVTGQVDLESEPDLSRSISSALEQSPAVLVVDLSRVALLTSAGMAVLLGSHNRASERTRFRIVATGKASLRPLQILGLTNVMSVFPTLDEALAAA